MIREVIVLAGGFGTRLASVIQDMPKPMAPVAGKPFLQYILDDLSQQGMKRCVLAVGHLRHVIMDYFGSAYAGMDLIYSEEEEPLGTGGGIRQATEYLEGDQAFVINGDTYFAVDLKELQAFHEKSGAQLTLALKKMYRFDRYGTVEADGSGRIVAFLEKQYREEGLINGGVYCLRRSVFSPELPAVFSFEKEILEQQFRQGHLYGMESDAYFIDIGIPVDYQQAQTDLLSRPVFDKSWSVFLDRDGVLNRRIPGDYVRRPEDLEILSGVPEAVASLSDVFGHVFIVTNQQGIGKGLYTPQDLELVHEKLLFALRQAGGRVDAVYFCPHLANDPQCDCRKPKNGMALQARRQFPEIDLTRSVMIGDSPSDIGFGRYSGMYTVAIQDFPRILADESADDLPAWVSAIS